MIAGERRASERARVCDVRGRGVDAPAGNNAAAAAVSDFVNALRSIGTDFLFRKKCRATRRDPGARAQGVSLYATNAEGASADFQVVFTRVRLRAKRYGETSPEPWRRRTLLRRVAGSRPLPRKLRWTLAAACMFSLLAPASARSQESGNLTGRWVLNRNQSQVDNQIGFNPAWLIAGRTPNA